MMAWDPQPWDQSTGQHFYTRLFNWHCVQAWTERRSDVVSLTVDVLTLNELNREFLGDRPGVCAAFVTPWEEVRDRLTIRRLVNRITGTEVLVRLATDRNLAFDVEEERYGEV